MDADGRWHAQAAVWEQIVDAQIAASAKVALDSDQARNDDLIDAFRELAIPVTMGEPVDRDVLVQIAGRAAAWALAVPSPPDAPERPLTPSETRT